MNLSFTIGDIEYSNFNVGNITALIAENKISQEQADELVFNCHVKEKFKEINERCSRELELLTQSYPVEEVATFDKQEQEARAYLADNSSPTPFIDHLASARGMGKLELVNRIIAKADAFIGSASIIGKRHKLEDELNSLDVSTHSLADIAAIHW